MVFKFNVMDACNMGSIFSGFHSFQSIINENLRKISLILLGCPYGFIA